MYALYYHPGNASLMPHMMLREIGVPFELRLVDRASNAQKSAAYLALNPNGLIPVLVDGDRAIYETAAIALYLADRHPEAALAPPPNAPARGQYYKWMIHFTNALQSEFRIWFYPHEFVVDPALADEAKRAVGSRLEKTFARIAEQLGEGPWLLGEQFSAADLYLFMFVRWGRAMPTPPRSIPALAAHAQRIAARPAVQAALAAEGLAAPFV